MLSMLHTVLDMRYVQCVHIAWHVAVFATDMQSHDEVHMMRSHVMYRWHELVLVWTSDKS